MRPRGVIEVEPLGNDPLGGEAVGEFVQVDGLVFERAPEALDEDVVHAAAPAIHGDGDAGVFEHSRELEAGELAALVGIEDLGPAVAVQGFSQGLDAGPGIQGIGQPPGEHTAGGPVHDGQQVQEVALDGNVGYVRAPDLIGPLDGEPLQKIGINPVLRDAGWWSAALGRWPVAPSTASDAEPGDDPHRCLSATNDGPSGGCRRTGTLETVHRSAASTPGSAHSHPWACRLTESKRH